MNQADIPGKIDRLSKKKANAKAVFERALVDFQKKIKAIQSLCVHEWGKELYDYSVCAHYKVCLKCGADGEWD